MSDMRRIGNLFVNFKEQFNRLQLVKAPETVHVKDLVSRTKFPALEAGMYHTTNETETSKVKAVV